MTDLNTPGKFNGMGAPGACIRFCHKSEISEVFHLKISADITVFDVIVLLVCPHDEIAHIHQ